jgi:hypothetical protein
VKLEWLREVEWKEDLNPDQVKIIELVGFDNFIKLQGEFAKTHVYFTEKPIMELVKKYIQANSNMTTKDLARKLGMSEFFVSSELGKREKDTDQIDIFERNS